MNSKHLLFALFLIFALGCINESKSADSQPIKLEGLTLNNNEKWVANEETHVGMTRIDSILNNIPKLDGKVLGNALSNETSYIIKSCDMKGIAHDQLHIVLVPILEKISEIKDTENTDNLNSKINHLKSLVSTYFNYFKT
ncbi:hypothetical protein [Winogradskyella vincentii]|uniref:Uncharacterized protein n=1 Tax=Winogradskyella vincentii TaxID=2877122 RepID=A0ABS7XY98_9FLAO|nr:hypothetical protein [Winogradskyella vincentii]MCA0152636.1 hypothetical protein [Winogradskyella vincentii]